jgi:hypothetical protein
LIPEDQFGALEYKDLIRPQVVGTTETGGHPETEYAPIGLPSVRAGELAATW